MNENGVVIFADGSSIGNPGPGGWGALVAFPHGEVLELGGSAEHTTNNKMELRAAIEALKEAEGAGAPVTLYTDSSYVINGITKWVHAWQKTGWVTKAKTPVENRELWEALLEIVQIVEATQTISWKHVPGHSNIPGNMRVDEIANGFARGEKINLHHGADYGVDLRVHKAALTGRSGKVYSYVSMVDGKLETHKTWDECKKRVEGQKGARYKKVFSKEEEAALLKEWSHAH
jgi:ribonuclease HI